MTQWYHALLIRALRRVLKKEYGVEFGLIDMFNKIEESYKINSEKVINDILENEKYLGSGTYGLALDKSKTSFYFVPAEGTNKYYI